MYRKKPLILLIFLLMNSANADMLVTCPSVQDIKQGNFEYWLPLYKEGEELASQKDVSLFRSHVITFEVARWASSYLESGHCFYRGTDSIIDKIVLAQDAWRPANHATWVWITPNKYAECYSQNVKECEFIK